MAVRNQAVNSVDLSQLVKMEPSIAGGSTSVGFGTSAAVAATQGEPPKSIRIRFKTLLIKPSFHTCSPQPPLCGFPSFCEDSASVDCTNTSLSDCELCSTSNAAVLISFVALLALVVVIGNLLVIWSVFGGGRENMTKIGLVKASLAAADLLNGGYISGIILPNIIWTLRSTAGEIDNAVRQSMGSTTATFGFLFFSVILVASVYHLTLISIMQFGAVMWPVRNRNLRKGNVIIGIAFTWLVAAVAASWPMCFPDSFTSIYQHEIFAYFVELTSNKQTTAGTIAICASGVVPYLITIILIFTTGVLVRRQLQTSIELTANKRKILKRQRALNTSLAFMAVGFTVTTVPAVIVIFEFYNDHLNCSTISTPYAATFLISCCRSAVNVLVYSFRHKQLRKNLRTALGNSRLSYPKMQRTAETPCALQCGSSHQPASAAH